LDQPVKNLFSDIGFHIVQIFPGADEPVKGGEFFDKGNFWKNQVFVFFGFGLGFSPWFSPMIGIESFLIFSGNPDHVTNYKFTLGILHIEKVLSLHFRAVGKQLFYTVEVNGKKISPPVIESHGSQGFLYQGFDFRPCFFLLAGGVDVFGYGPSLQGPVPEFNFQSGFDPGFFILHIINPAVHLGSDQILSVFQVLGTQDKGFPGKIFPFRINP